MLKASIDLGTNTCLLLVADVDQKTGKVARVLSDTSTIVRLGQGVDQSGALHPDAIERTRACLRGYAGALMGQGLKPSDTIALATATARDAKNGAEFFASIERDFGFKFRTISGDEEARLMFEGGLLPSTDSAQSVVIDIGGGSTEFRSLDLGVSLQMGSVRFTERFFKSDPVTDREFWACRDAVDAQLNENLGLFFGKVQTGAVSKLVGVAGTITALAGWHLGLTKFDAAKIDGTILTRGDCHRMVEELKWRTIAERRELPGIESARADVLLAGALILWRTLEVLGFKECVVSTRGLRFGALVGSVR